MVDIQDFGNKIEGAKKDIAQIKKNGGLNFENISLWNEDERNQFINKDTVFPLPKYKELYESGEYSREALYAIKRVRDSIAKTPNLDSYDLFKLQTAVLTMERRGENADEKKAEFKRKVFERQDEYVKSVSYIRDTLLEIKTLEDAVKVMNTLDSYSRDLRNKGMNAFDSKKFYKAVYVSPYYSANYTKSRIVAEMSEKKFLYSDEEKALSNFTINKYNGNNVKYDTTYSGPAKKDCIAISSGCGTSYYYSVKSTPEIFDLNNWQENTYFVINNGERGIKAINLPSAEAAKEYILAELAPKEKETSSRSRKTKFVPPQLKHIERTGEDYREGASITGDIMLETFGFYGGQFGNWENQNDRQYNLDMSFEAFKDLAAALQIQDKDISLGGELGIAYGARGRSGAVAHYEPTNKVINLTKMRGAGSLAHEWGHALDHYIARQLDLGTTYATNKTEVNSIAYELKRAIKYDGDNKYSKYFSDAQKMDKLFSKSDKGYWASDVEMFARAFACYVKDKLSPERSDYLCGHAECGSFEYKGQTIYSYPVGEDRERINKAFDSYFKELKSKGIISQRGEEKLADIYRDKIDRVIESIDRIISEEQDCQKLEDVLYALNEVIEEYDKNDEIDKGKFLDGIVFVEGATAEQLETAKGTLLEAVNTVMENCGKLNVGSAEKEFFFDEVENKTETIFEMEEVIDR